VGRDFDETGWKEGHLPSLEMMDRAFPSRPVIIRRACGHVAVANTLALERIGPEWEIVHRDTGVLEEDIVLRLDEVLDVDEEEIHQGVQRGIQKAFSLGIVGSGEIVNLRQFNVIKNLETDFRFKAYLPFEDAQHLITSGIRAKTVFGCVEFCGIKVFMDGSIGGRTAALFEPYFDGDGRGMLLVSAQELRKMAKYAHEHGLRLMVHAIGDLAIHEVLTGLEGLVERGNPLGHTIEHAEVLNPYLIERIAKTGMGLSMQPNFAGRWSGENSMNLSRLGRDRHRWCNPYKSVFDANIPMGFGSDCMPFEPFFGLRSAISHPVHQERLTPGQAIDLYTHKSRRLLGFGLDEGDVLTLSGNPFDKDTRVVSLSIKGKTVFSKEDDIPNA
ncbi:MAG TPA: hypothetical protein ENN76_02555, partial [Euryarchaeota archaeon]|nr:hypothetical protein [Euryarchaeota archaeon]